MFAGGSVLLKVRRKILNVNIAGKRLFVMYEYNGEMNPEQRISHSPHML